MTCEELLLAMATAIRTEAVGANDQEGAEAWLPEARSALGPVVRLIRSESENYGCDSGPRRGCDQDCSDCRLRDTLTRIADELEALLIKGPTCPSCGRDNHEHGDVCTSDDCPGVQAKSGSTEGRSV